MTPPTDLPGPEPLFVIRGLEKRYDGKPVLGGLDFEVTRGESLVILGRSGSGKSVTLRQLNGLEKPDAGSVTFDGVEISALSESQLFPYRRRIAMLFQSGALFDSMTVFDNVAFPLRQHTDLDRDRVAATVADKLALVELEGVEETMPAELSGGMRKRVALARSLALDPQVVLFDEPTTGLDPMTSATIAHLIRSARERLRTTSVVVTHDLALAREVATRVAFLDGGRFRFLGTWDEAEGSSDPLLARFLAGQREES
ncbi:MAG TPA: ATP-binding cassette domain-containing protein [Thermoanaerobaculia bacterium]|nr:ATP-binding cassette domain-containing protein [Thermoanaerobaculia bacterium]